jgi:hypothetical protein
LFFDARGLDWGALLERLNVDGKPHLYVIRNGRLKEHWNGVERRLAPIVNRTVSSLIRSQGIGDLTSLYLLSEHNGFVYSLAHVPNDFTMLPSEPFDPEYMAALFKIGYDQGRSGNPWSKLLDVSADESQP